MKVLPWTVFSVLAASLAAALWAPRVAPRPAVPLLREDEDLAVACLVWGEETPELTEVPDERVDAWVELLARLLSSYGSADFDAFLALRGGAARVEGDPTRPTAELRDLALSIGAREEDVGGTWLTALRAFWGAYYREGPPVARWVPEATRLLRGDPEAGDGERSAAFDDLRRALGPAPLTHHLVLPPREEDVRESVRRSRPWFDLVLGFETPQLTEGRLLVRFVQCADEPDRWLLQRAASFLEHGSHSPATSRQLIL